MPSNPRTMAPSAVSDSNGISLATDTGKTNSQEPTPLEAISQGEVLPGIPVFPDYVSERKHILTHMAATFRQWSRLAFTEGQVRNYHICLGLSILIFG